MSEENTAQEANPYNAKKSWINYDNTRGLQGADDSMSFQDPKASNKDVEATQEKDTQVEEKEAPDTKYNKVDYKKRYDDMKRHYDSKLIEWKAKEEELKTLATASAPKIVPKTPEELATFKEQYPDVYDVVETVAQKQAQEQIEEVNKEVAKLKERELELLATEAMLKLEKAHPDFQEISDSDEFHEWAKNQPSIIQEWIYENPTNSDLAIRAIDLYKKDNGMFSTGKEQSKPVKKVQEEGDAADAVLIKDSVDPSAKEKKVWSESEIRSLSIQQFEQYEEEIQAAMKEGRIRQG